MDYIINCNFCFIEMNLNERARHRYLCKKHGILLGKNTYEPPDLRIFIEKNKQGNEEINMRDR